MRREARIIARKCTGVLALGDDVGVEILKRRGAEKYGDPLGPPSFEYLFVAALQHSGIDPQRASRIQRNPQRPPASTVHELDSERRMVSESGITGITGR